MSVWASGKYAKKICDRCGWKYDYLEIRTEAGTNIDVCPECDDGKWNRVDHPLNYPPKDLVDGMALQNPGTED